MAASKIAITLESDTLKRLDMLVKSNIFPNRSKAIQEAVAEKLTRMEPFTAADAKPAPLISTFPPRSARGEYGVEPYRTPSPRFARGEQGVRTDPPSGDGSTPH